MYRSFAPTFATVLCPLAFCLSGCGGGEAQSAAGDQSGRPGSSAATPEAAVVREFLKAAQAGDRDAACQRLTAKAVQAFEEHDVPFLTAAITSGTFQLGRTVESGSTHFVQGIWTDESAGVDASSEKIQWMLKQDGGEEWRIYGLAVFMEDRGENMVFNFEQPQEMLMRGQQERAGTPGAAGTAAPPQQATLPQDPFQTAPR
jgi:hypothetical protein